MSSRLGPVVGWGCLGDGSWARAGQASAMASPANHCQLVNSTPCDEQKEEGRREKGRRRRAGLRVCAPGRCTPTLTEDAFLVMRICAAVAPGGGAELGQARCKRL